MKLHKLKGAKVDKEILSTYNRLNILLRLSIAGLFIVASMNYLFNNLIKSLENRTISTRQELNILKHTQKITLDTKYTFEKLSTVSSSDELEKYQEEIQKNLKESDYLINVLKFGGEVNLDNATPFTFMPTQELESPAIISEQEIRGKVIENLNKIADLLKEKEHFINSSEDSNYLKLFQIQKRIDKIIKDNRELLQNRLKTLYEEILLVKGRLKEINSQIEKKRDVYIYAQILTFLFIVLSLIYSSKPIRDKILEANIKLHEANKKVQKMVEESQKANVAKSEFLANMSHEIRTPLNAILGFIDLLREKEDDKEKLSYLQTIHSSSYTLLGIINDILDFSKIESGNLTIDKTDFNVEDEFKSVVDLFRAKASEKSINLTLKMDPNLPSALYGDPLRIKQIIANLLSNAIKFTPRNGKVELSISYKNKKLHVKVKDTGIGIEKSKQADIFKAFSQAESSTTRKYGGTGLGLAISSKLVSLMGGELKLESEPGKGSTFYFDIDIGVGKYQREAKIKEQDIEAMKGKKVLLVEDNKANQMFMSLLLKKLNMNFKIANDGIEAVEAFKNDKFDIILMDENMPNLNGIEATKQILEIEQKEKRTHTPIIALTANALKGDREKFLEAGMDEYLTKPVNKERLVEKMSLFLYDRESVS